MKRAFGVALLSLVVATIGRAAGTDVVATPQAPQTAPPQAPARDTDEGIPITNDLTVQVCGECHKVDGKFRMSRISYRRTTPEGWQETIRRMVTLNKAQIDPADARGDREVPLGQPRSRAGGSQARRVRIRASLIDHTYTANADTAGICSSCHSMGRVMLQRRPERTGMGLSPCIEAGIRWWTTRCSAASGRRARQPGPDGRPPDNRHPMDKALAHLKSAFPLTTPEWSAWSATMRRPRIEGTWALTGYEAGEGPIVGRVVIAAGASPDEFTTTTTFTYTKSGRAVSRTGRAGDLHGLSVARADDRRW